MSTLAVIPARGGSKGISKKNLRLLGGLPLVMWAITAAKLADTITHIVLTTDSEEIAEIGYDENIDVIFRDSSLATDKALTIDVLADVIDKVSVTITNQCQSIVLLEPTSPFRSPRIIDECTKTFGEMEGGSVFTVTQLERNPANIFFESDGITKRYVKNPIDVYARRQEYQHLKRINGAVYVSSKDSILRGCLLSEPFATIEMNPELSINIDTELDLLLAETIIEKGLLPSEFDKFLHHQFK
ncbi:MAG: hypothetical protein CL398_01955 [Acidiferrobacteraceae bacterium]|nr:hypothetical protein [Acidiferrobacteraceae bacterium]